MSAEVQAINNYVPYGHSERARSFVAELRTKCKFDDPAAEYLAARLGELLDEMEECKSMMRANGSPFYKDRFGKPRLHPAALREIALQNEYGKAYRLLGLDQPPPDQGKLDF
jgi:hypothetical protein